jgi:hypothetical protein
MQAYGRATSRIEAFASRHRRRALVVGLCGGLAAASPLPHLSAQTCINFAGGSNQYPAVLATTASPYIWSYTNGTSVGFGAAYDSNTHTLMVGDLNGPTPTGISIDDSNGLGDVTATYLNGVHYLALLQSNQMRLTTSSDAIHWGNPTVWTISGAGAFNNQFTPALQTYNGVLYAAYVVGSVPDNSFVYLASSSNGSSWTQLGQVSSVRARSRPTLAVFNGHLFIGFTSSGHTGQTAGAPYVGVVVTGSTFAPNVIQQGGTWGNSNTHGGIYAGILLAPSNVSGTQQLYILGQGTSSSQNLYETNSSTGNNFPQPINCSIQLRYTPTGYYYGGFTTINFQGDHNTNVWWATQ